MKGYESIEAPVIKTKLPGPKAKRYLEDAKKYEPRSMSEHVPIVWKKAKGVVIEDVDGNTFLDFCSGVLVVNIGHSHPELVREIQEQAEDIVNSYDFVNIYRPALVKKLVEITPNNLDKAFILTTGAETTEAALKLSRLYSGKYEFLSFHGCFHGRTYGAMSVGGKRSSASTKGFGPFLPGVIMAPFCYCYRCVFGKQYPKCGIYCIDYLDWIMTTESEGKVAACISELYQGGAGSIVPPKEYYKRLEQWCKARDILLIIDEVQSSFGRTGKLFGIEHYGIKPNLLCLGKGISSSVPISALMGESRIMNVLSPGTMSSTHGGNAFCSRIALKNIEIIIRDKLADNADKLGRYLAKRFKQMVDRYEFVGDARGMGLVWGIEIVKSKKTKQPGPDIATKIVHAAYRRGLVMMAPIGFYGSVLRVAPPLVITEEQCKKAVDILESAIKDVQKGL